jgi:hypothetical protein
MDVSLYIRDAQDMVIPLLGGRKSGHDWHYLLTKWDLIDSCQDIGDAVYFLGLAIAIGAIIGGISWAVVSYVESGKPQLPKVLA